MLQLTLYKPVEAVSPVILPKQAFVCSSGDSSALVISAIPSHDPAEPAMTGFDMTG